jgi:hypothetical protein
VAPLAEALNDLRARLAGIIDKQFATEKALQTQIGIQEGAIVLGNED